METANSHHSRVAITTETSYCDADGIAVDPAQAARVIVKEFDENGNLIRTSISLNLRRLVRKEE
ncbi:MAG: hypothetical protein P4N59_02380 [Negativicutes bacterium]|nr:hypothetical protein [Negativicutes bacterium]